MNDKLRRIWKEADAVSFEANSQYLTGSTDENHENLSQDSQLSGRELNSVPAEHEI